MDSKELSDKAEELGLTGPDGDKWRERALEAEGKLREFEETYIKVIEVIEHEDGSATVTMDLSYEVAALVMEAGFHAMLGRLVDETFDKLRTKDE